MVRAGPNEEAEARSWTTPSDVPRQTQEPTILLTSSVSGGWLYDPGTSPRATLLAVLVLYIPQGGAIQQMVPLQPASTCPQQRTGEMGTHVSYSP